MALNGAAGARANVEVAPEREVLARAAEVETPEGGE